MKDVTIVDLFWNRDEAAIGAVREQYGKYCRKIAMNVLGSEEDAEECVSDAFLALWGRIPPARPQSLRAFLGKITRNIAVNRYRQNQSQPTRQTVGNFKNPLFYKRKEKPHHKKYRHTPK